MILLHHSWVYNQRNQSQHIVEINVQNHMYCGTVHNSQDIESAKLLINE
jgi:hypothetical protein